MSIDWKDDYESALAAARRQGRLLVVHFWLEGRPLYRAMNDETFKHPEVVALSNARFVNVKVDLGARPELFERLLGGRGGLGTAVVDATGDVVSALAGYAGPERYLDLLRRAEQGYGRLRAARAAAARAPGELAALCALGEAYEALGSPRRAEEQFEKLVRPQPAAAQAAPEAARYAAVGHERLARYRALAGRNREAAPHLAEYRRLDPDNRFGRLDRVAVTEALVAWIERRFDAAIRRLEEALGRFPASPERNQMLLGLGTVRHEAGDDAGALRALDRLLKEHPQSDSVAKAKEQIAHIKNPPPDHQH
jgi:tetratricopeptide (TPR) repeat protein